MRKVRGIVGSTRRYTPPMTTKVLGRVRRVASACNEPDRLADAVEGYAAVNGRFFVSRYQGKLQAYVVFPFAFSDALKSHPLVHFQRDHDDSRRLGSTASNQLQLAEDARGLAYRFSPRATPEGRSLLNDARAHRLRVSCGFIPEETEERTIGDTLVHVVKAARLIEISAVPEPAVDRTSLYVVPADGPSFHASLASGEIWRRQQSFHCDRTAAGVIEAFTALLHALDREVAA